MIKHYQLVTLFKAVWGDAYTPRTSIVQGDYFSEDVGYDAEDIAKINNLKAGETWTSSRVAEHTVLSYGQQVVITDSRIPRVKQEVVLTYGRYQNGNLYIGSVTLDDEQDQWADFTVNMGSFTPTELKNGLVCIKNYSEGEGAVDLLLESKVLESIDSAPKSQYYLSDEVLKIALATIKVQDENP